MDGIAVKGLFVLEDDDEVDADAVTLKVVATTVVNLLLVV